MALDLDAIFQLVVDHHASDVIFVPGMPPTMWVMGAMQPSPLESLSPADIDQAFLPLLNEEQAQRLREVGDLDFSLGRKDIGRLRVNIHRQRGSYSVAVRFISYRVRGFDELSLPARMREFAELPRGLVLVTGGAATGKSTTLAAMIDYMNRNFEYHIVTLEDPIEYTFRHQKSIIEQREIGSDSPSFASALRHVVRQRPDVVLIGEMRDLETISAALTAAETGHLVLATLHTNSAVQAVDRIIDIFPASQQSQVRVQLSCCLQGITCQMLFHDQLNGNMTPAMEILVPTPAIRRAIRDRETHLLAGMVETGRSLGMQSMDVAISELVRAGRITPRQAVSQAQDAEKMKRMLAA